MAALEAALTAAIARGAPQYNRGDVAGCAQTYGEVARSVLASGLASGAAAERLRAGLREGDAAPADAAAWALRRAFDAVLAADTAPPTAVLSFRAALPADARLEIVNDTVMGGGSSASLRHDSQRGALLFTGELSTSGGGGFASFRCGARAWPADAEGVLVMAASEGQARELKVTARTDAAWDGVGYQAALSLGAGAAAETHRLPFSAFRATFRGRDVPNAPPLSAASLRRLGVMLSRFDMAGKALPGFVPGPFALAVYELGTYS